MSPAPPDSSFILSLILLKALLVKAFSRFSISSFSLKHIYGYSQLARSVASSLFKEPGALKQGLNNTAADSVGAIWPEFNGNYT